MQQQTQKVNHWVFASSDGTLTEDAKAACAYLFIDPADLKPRTLEYFKEEKKCNEQIAKINFERYEDRRKSKIKMIEETIKNGMLTALQETFATAPQNMSPKGNSAGMSARKNYGGRGSVPAATLSAAAQGGRLQMHGHTQSMMMGGSGGSQTVKGLHRTNFSSPEVPLREPLGQDYSLDRRLANQIYARDKMQGAAERRDAAEQIKIAERVKMLKTRTEEQKAREKKAKENKDVKVAAIAEIKVKREDAVTRVTEAASSYNSKMRTKDAKMQSAYQIMRKEKEQSRRALQEQNFLEDMKAMEKKRHNRDQEAKKEQEIEKETADRVLLNDILTEEKRLNKARTLAQRSEEVGAKLAKVDEIHVKMIEDSKNIKPFFVQHEEFTAKTKQIEALKKKEKEELEFRFKEIADKRSEVVKMQGDKKQEYAGKMYKLQRRLKEQEKAADAIKKAKDDDFARRKELLALNKQDQTENYMRGKHFQNLYKQKLVERMWEKAQRAENVKQKNTIISNSGIRFSQENSLARVGGANRSISK